jgi:hypothetical protein
MQVCALHSAVLLVCPPCRVPHQVACMCSPAAMAALLCAWLLRRLALPTTRVGHGH